MLQSVNLEEVRQYNTNLKSYKDKAATLNAEIEYTNKEIDALCAELSAELGKQVTRDNIEQIYNEQVESINSTLQSGNAVLAKIASEEQGVNQVATNVSQPIPQTVVPQPVAQQPMAQPVNAQPVNAQPITPQPMTMNQSVVPQPTVAQQAVPQPVQGSVFNGQATPMPGQPVNQLPPMFTLPN